MATDDAEAEPRPPLRLGWLSTGRGPGSRALLTAVHQAISEGTLDASIQFVFCTRDRGEAEGSDEFLALAETYGLTTISLSVREYRENQGEDAEWRDRYNADLLGVIRQQDVDALVFAGLMLVVSEDVVAEYPALNLHPALPGGPIGAWQDVIWELIDKRATESGVMVQLSTPEVDTGPVIAWCRFSLQGPEFSMLWRDMEGQSVDELRRRYGENHALFAKIRQEGLRREALTLVEALRLIAEGTVRIEGGAVMAANGARLDNGLDITDTIERLLDEPPAHDS